MYNEQIKNFIEKHILMIENGWFSDLYEMCLTELSATHIGMLTRILYDSEIDPLRDLDYVPAYFLYDQNFSGTFEIPEGITEIRTSAFDGTNIEAVKLPSTLVSINDNAFFMSGLKSVVLPESLKVLSAETFEYCENLKSVEINSNLKSIPPRCFRFCSNLERVVIPKNVVKINSYAFGGIPENCTFVVDKNSTAEDYALKVGHPVEYIL